MTLTKCMAGTTLCIAKAHANTNISACMCYWILEFKRELKPKSKCSFHIQSSFNQNLKEKVMKQFVRGIWDKFSNT